MAEQKGSPGGRVESADALSSQPDGPAHPWQKQPWESTTAFKRFTEFYLTQQPPRSLAEAYRRFRLKSGLDPAQARCIKYAPAAWKNWAYARDTYGRPIPSALTWAERAAKYDFHLVEKQLQEEEQVWAERRAARREAEWTTGEALLERARRMMQALLFRKVSEETTSEDGKTFITHITYEPAGWNERDIATALKTASDLMRRGAGEPPNNPPPSGDDWREQARRDGFDPDEVKRVVQRALLQCYRGEKRANAYDN